MISTTKSSSKRKGSSLHKYERIQTVRKIATITATGTRFINGIAMSYDERFPKQLNGLADRQKYQQSMKYLNRKIKQFWPCCFAYYCGYCCAPVSLGLSLLIPRICINQAETILKKQIIKINNVVLGNSKLEMRLVKKCFESQLVIQQRDFAAFQLNNDIIL